MATWVPAAFCSRFLPAAAFFSALSASRGSPALGAFALPASDIDDLTGLLGEADRTAVAELLESDPRRTARLRIDMGDIGQVDRSFFAHDAALGALSLALVALDDVDAADQRAVLGREHLDDLALLALVAARRDDDAVALLDLGNHHSTSGASEMIFMWFLARSSRVTGPKMRVPIGSFCALISTAALPSKRIRLPSERRTPLAVRTTTAFRTSPFLTRP